MQFSHFYNRTLGLTYLTNLPRPNDIELFHLSDQIPWKKGQGNKVMQNRLNRSIPKSHYQNVKILLQIVTSKIWATHPNWGQEDSFFGCYTTEANEQRVYWVMVMKNIIKTVSENMCKYVHNINVLIYQFLSYYRYFETVIGFSKRHISFHSLLKVSKKKEFSQDDISSCPSLCDSFRFHMTTTATLYALP